ncbi:hypothetical protein AB0K52_17550 [Glycomyces sp. NPDC049804]|uniref:hypothetical protein n=1 Tax=Glycomyces sp. NPDC049804 TaxID=3154363 RepID=UPI003420CD40
MASTRVRGAGPLGRGPDLDRVPERMDFVGGWVTGEGEKIELWTDNRIGDGLLVQSAPEWERLATLYYAGGVTRATVWHGAANERSEEWREGQKARVAAAIAVEFSNGPGSFYKSTCGA